MDLSELILTEIRDTRKELNEGFTELRQRSTALETTIEPFFEQGGDKDQIEAEISSLQKTKYYALGGAGVLTTLGHWLLHKFNL